VDARIRIYDLSDLHDLFEAAQIVLYLLSRFFPQQLCNAGANPSARRVVLNVYPDDRAAPARCRLKFNPSLVVHI
jgi:hypothetical protein